MTTGRKHSSRIPANNSKVSAPSPIKRLCVALEMDSQRMKLVDKLVSMCPLQVQLDLSDQREAVSISYVQLLRFIYAVFLQEKKVRRKSP